MTTMFRFLLAATVLFMAIPIFGQSALERADQAFAAGDSERALAAYQEALQEDPRNVHALVQSAKLLSWDSRYDDALQTYERVIQIDPDNQSALRERAKVLSWAQRYTEAEEAFRNLLSRTPSDREARLGLARVLSWSGQQRAARAEYESILKLDEGDAEATVGVAQTLAWSGDLIEARQWYQRAMEIDPGLLGSQLGIAYLELGEGDLREAGRLSSELQRQYPDDRDVAQLVEAVERADDPWYRGSWERLEDTDLNELDITRLEVGWALPARARLTLGVARFDMSSPLGEGKIDSPSLVLLWMPSSSDRVTLRAGADLIETSDDRSETELIGGLSWVRELPRNWRFSAAVDHDSFRYSVQILDALVTTTNYGVRLNGEPGRYFRTTLGAGGADFSDDNQQINADLGLWLRLPTDAFTAEIGYVGRYLDFDRDLNNGYFDPQEFRSHVGQVRLRGDFGESNAYWSAQAESGIQSFTLGSREVDDDELFGWSATLGIPLGRAASLELFGGRSDYALNAATGFESEQYGIRLRLQP